VLQAVSLLIEKGKAGYDEVNQKMQAQADLQTRVAAQLGTLKNMWDAATGTAVNALAAIGGVFQGEAKGMTDMFGSMSSWMSEFASNNPGVVRGLVAAAGMFVAIKIAALGVAGAIGLINMVTAMSPLGIMVRLLAVAAGMIIANWSSIAPFFADLWDGICAGATKVVEWVKGMWAKVQPYVQPIIDFYSKFYGGMWAGVKSFGAGASSLFAQPQPAPAGLPANGGLLGQAVQQGKQQVSGEMTVRFVDAPPGMRVDQGRTSSPSWSLDPDVGYRSAALGMQ